VTVLDAEAFLFDSDGVLVDSDHTVEQAWGAWSTSYDLDPDEVVLLAHGTPSRQTVDRLIAEPHRAEALAMIDRLELELADEVRALPGAVELLSALPAGTWTIVTSGTTLLAEARLRAAGLPVPAALVTADDVARGKPHPEPYLTGAAHLRRPVGVCAVFEDASAGVAAARAAGVREVVGVTRHNEGVDFFVPDLRSVSVEGGAVRVAAERLSGQDEVT
jgi:sugar-phosphatase